MGLDPSWSQYGVVSYDLTTGAHETYLLKTTGTKGDVITFRRMEKMRQQLVDALRASQAAGDVVHVCLEDFARGAQNGREESGMIRAVTLNALGEVFGDEQIAYPTLVSTGGLKKFCTGSGSVHKQQVLLAVYKKWGVDITNDNLADAYGLARVAAALESPASATLQYERDVLSNLGRHTSWQPPSRTPPPKTSSSSPARQRRPSSG